MNAVNMTEDIKNEDVGSFDVSSQRMVFHLYVFLRETSKRYFGMTFLFRHVSFYCFRERERFIINVARELLRVSLHFLP